MKIAISMIALNEAKFIARSVASCTFADYICIVDGGSNDATERLAREACPEGADLVWKVVPWSNHFGNQRQHALHLVPYDADWWLRIDSDERYSQDFIEGIRPTLESLPEDVLAVRIRQTNLTPDEDHYAASHGGWETHPRIFRNMQLPDGRHAYQWVGQVHEYLKWMTDVGLIDIPEEKRVTYGAQVYHYGWLERARREEREDLYSEMPGSGIKKRGDLTERRYVIRELPLGGR